MYSMLWLEANQCFILPSSFIYHVKKNSRLAIRHSSGNSRSLKRQATVSSLSSKVDARLCGRPRVVQTRTRALGVRWNSKFKSDISKFSTSFIFLTKVASVVFSIWLIGFKSAWIADSRIGYRLIYRFIDIGLFIV